MHEQMSSTISFLKKKYKTPEFCISAATGENLRDMFHKLIDQINSKSENQTKKMMSPIEVENVEAKKGESGQSFVI